MSPQNRKKLRLEHFDYSQPGGYFITVCAKNRRCCLSAVGAGHLTGPAFQLTAAGEVVDRLVRQLPNVYPNLSLEHYIIMPNHIHLLLRLSQTGPAGCPAPTTDISKVVGALKSLSARAIGAALWQRSFYDHVIRDEEDYLRIWNYIDTNPAKWAEDRYDIP